MSAPCLQNGTSILNLHWTKISSPIKAVERRGHEVTATHEPNLAELGVWILSLRRNEELTKKLGGRVYSVGGHSANVFRITDLKRRPEANHNPSNVAALRHCW